MSSLDLSGREFRVALAVMRKTYGFQKKSDWIALDQLVEATGIAKENISRIVSALVQRKLFLKEGAGYTKKLGINTVIKDWMQPEQIVKNDNEDASGQQNVENNKLLDSTIDFVGIDNGIVENDKKDVGFRQPQKKKETIPKENTKDIYGAFDFSKWPEKPSQQVWSDWKSHRKGKRASINQTVINRMASELHKAFAMGYSVDHCLAEAQEAGWQGFVLEWMLSRNRTRGSPSAPSPKRHNDFESRDYTAGITSDGTF